VKEPVVRENTLRHLGTGAIYTVVSVFLFGIVYPLLVTGLATLAFPRAAAGSYVSGGGGGGVVGSRFIGQAFASPRYFAPRPSAAGKNGYDPTATGGTNLAPTSKKLVDATRASIVALRKANPDARGPVPLDLVTSSASGIDPEISPEAAEYQVPRVARSRGLSEAAVRAVVARVRKPRTFGALGEPRVNVLELNLALDRTAP